MDGMDESAVLQKSESLDICNSMIHYMFFFDKAITLSGGVNEIVKVINLILQLKDRRVFYDMRPVGHNLTGVASRLLDRLCNPLLFHPSQW